GPEVSSWLDQVPPSTWTFRGATEPDQLRTEPATSPANPRRSHRGWPVPCLQRRGVRVSLRSGLSHHSFPRGIRAKLELGLLALTCGYPISAQAQPPEQDSPASPLAQGDTQEDTGATASPPPQSAERITLPEPLNTPVAPVPGT